MKRKGNFKPIGSLIFIGLLVFIGLFIWWRWATSPVDKTATTAQIFVIPKGQSLDKIGKRLKQVGLIRSVAAFKLYVIKSNLTTKVQAGDFRLKASMTLPQLAQELTHGTLDVWVTLLEGWRREEMAAKIAQEFLSREAEFDPQVFLDATREQEGYLFPDTYLLPRDASESTIASLIRSTFDQKVDLSHNESGLTDSQVVILASIVEREIRTDADRPLVAGILIKRLKNDWPLQADATVQYALGSRDCRRQLQDCTWWKEHLTTTDLSLDSPFNTYKYQGLPPTPIANPGLASIKASLKPQASDYWFYLSDPQGNIHYAQTLVQHNDNINKYLNR